MVQYKIGIQNDDLYFLCFLHELLDNEYDVVLAINRCPVGISENDRRIKVILSISLDTI